MRIKRIDNAEALHHRTFQAVHQDLDQKITESLLLVRLHLLLALLFLWLLWLFHFWHSFFCLQY